MVPEKGVQKSLLPNHLGEGLQGYRGIIGGVREAASHGGVGVFEIGEVDVGDGLYQPQGFEPLVAGEVVDDGYADIALSQRSNHGNGVGEKVVRGHEVHVVNSLVLVERCQAVHNFLYHPLPAQTFMGDLIVLTELTSEGTAAEKDRSGSVFAADGGLLTQVGLNCGDAQLGSLPAETQLVRGPIHPTASGAELTGLVVREE